MIDGYVPRLLITSLQNLIRRGAPSTTTTRIQAALLGVTLACVACKSDPPRQTKASYNEPEHHQPKENPIEYYVTITDTGFIPSTLKMPGNRHLRILLDRKSRTICETVRLTRPDRSVEARTVRVEQPVELELDTTLGTYTLACLDADLHATISVQ